MPLWNPEGGTGLTNAALTAMAVEANSSKLWLEFLSGWFSGTEHVIGKTSSDVDVKQVFPLCDHFGFQLDPRPVNEGLMINCTIIREGQTRHLRKRGQRTNFNKVSWEFFIRAKVSTTRTDGHSSDSLCRAGADLLYGLLSLEELTKWLGDKGIGNIQPSPHRLVASQDWILRMLKVKATLVFPADFQQ